MSSALLGLHYIGVNSIQKINFHVRVPENGLKTPEEVTMELMCQLLLIFISKCLHFKQVTYFKHTMASIVGLPLYLNVCSFVLICIWWRCAHLTSTHVCVWVTGALNPIFLVYKRPFLEPQACRSDLLLLLLLHCSYYFLASQYIYPANVYRFYLLV